LENRGTFVGQRGTIGFFSSEASHWKKRGTIGSKRGTMGSQCGTMGSQRGTMVRWMRKIKTYFQCRFVPNFKRYFYYKCRPCII